MELIVLYPSSRFGPQECIKDKRKYKFKVAERFRRFIYGVTSMDLKYVTFITYKEAGYQISNSFIYSIIQ